MDVVYLYVLCFGLMGISTVYPSVLPKSPPCRWKTREADYSQLFRGLAGCSKIPPWGDINIFYPPLNKVPMTNQSRSPPWGTNEYVRLTYGVRGVEGGVADPKAAAVKRFHQ